MTSDNVISDWLTSLATFFDKTLYSLEIRLRYGGIQQISQECSEKTTDPATVPSAGINTHNISRVMDTDCVDRSKLNHHMIYMMTAHLNIR
jgi:hypothetical protein